MNALQKKQAELAKKVTELKSLTEKEELSADEIKAMNTLTTETKSLQGEIADLEAAEAQSRIVVKENPGPEVKAGIPVEDLKTPVTGIERKEVGETTIDLKAMRELGIDSQDELLIKTCEPTYHKAFRAYMVGKEDMADLKTLREATGSEGGYLVPADLLAELIRQRMPATALLKRVRVIQTGLNPVIINRRTEAITNRLQWVGETGQSSLDEPSFNQVTIPVHEATVPVEISKSLMEDASLAESEAMGWIADCMTYGLEETCVNGNGVAKPRGVLSGVGGTGRIASVNVGNPATADGIISLIGTLPSQYRAGATFVCNDTDAWTAITQLKDSDGRYVGWLGSIDSGGLANARDPRVLGFSADFSAAFPGLGAANNICAFGNWNEAYAAVQRLAIEIVRWAETKAESTRGVTGFTARLRYGGDVVAPWAARIGVQS